MKEPLLQSKKQARTPLPELIAAISWDRSNPDGKRLADWEEVVAVKALELERAMEREETASGVPYDEEELNTALADSARELNAPVVRALLKKNADASYCGQEAEVKSSVSILEEKQTTKMKDREHPLLAGLNTLANMGQTELGGAATSYQAILREYLKKIGVDVIKIRTLRLKRTLVMSMLAKSLVELAQWYLRGCELSPVPRAFPPDLYTDEEGKYPYVDLDGKTFLFYVYENTKESLKDFVQLVGDERMRLMLLNRPQDSEEEDSTGETLLMRAAANGDRKTVRFLLKNKADPTIVSKNGETAAYHAVRCGDEDALKILRLFFTRKGNPRSFGAYRMVEVDRPEPEGENKDKETYVELLCGSDEDNAAGKTQPSRHITRLVNHRQQNLLHVAAWNGRVEVCQQLVDAYGFGELIDVPDTDKRTPLILAAMQQQTDIMRLLLCIPLPKEETAKEAAPERLPAGPLQLLPPKPAPRKAFKPANRYLEDRLKKTALNYALALEHLDGIAVLLGGSTDSAALAAALPEETKEVLRRTVYEGGVTPLMKMAARDAKMVNLLLQAGVDPSARDSQKRSALLYLAAHCGDGDASERTVRESLHALLDREAQVGEADALGRTAMHLCSKYLHDERTEASAIRIIKALHEKDASLISTKDIFGRTPIAYAAIYGFGLQGYRKALAEGSRYCILAPDRDGMNALLWAAYAGREETGEMAEAAWSTVSWGDYFSQKLEYIDLLMRFDPAERLGVIEILAAKRNPVNVENVVRSRCSMPKGEDGEVVDLRAHAAMAFALHFNRLAALEDPRKDEFEAAQAASLTLAEKLLDELPAGSELIQRRLIVDLEHKTRELVERKKRKMALNLETKKHERAVEAHKAEVVRALREPRRGATQYVFGNHAAARDACQRILAGAAEQPAPAGKRNLLFDDLDEIAGYVASGDDLRLKYLEHGFGNPEDGEDERPRFITCSQARWSRVTKSETSETSGNTHGNYQSDAAKYLQAPKEGEVEGERDAVVREPHMFIAVRVWHDELPEDARAEDEPTRAVCGLEFLRVNRLRPGASVATMLGRAAGTQHELRVPPDMELIGLAGSANRWLYEVGLVLRPRGALYQSAVAAILHDLPAPVAPTETTIKLPDLDKLPGLAEGGPKSIIEMALEIGPSAGKIFAHPRIAEGLSTTWRGVAKPGETLVDLIVVKPALALAEQLRSGEAADETPAWNLFARSDAVFGTPRGKFFLEILFYICLLATYTVALNWQTEALNAADLVMFFLIASFVVGETSQVFVDGLKYFSSFWNSADTIIGLIFAAYYVIRFKNLVWFQHDDVIVAYKILAFNAILLWTRLLNTCDLHPTLGPLLAIIKNMASDTLTFLVVLLLVMLGFSQLIHILIITILEVNEQRVTDTVLFMFKTILGDMDLDFVIDRSSMLGFAIYAFYVVFSVIMLLNLLIAIYGGTYGRIADRAEQQFQYTRAETYLEYAGREYVPPPFNLIQFVVRCLVEWPLAALDRAFFATRDEADPEAPPAPSALGKAVDGLGTKVASFVLLLLLLPFILVIAPPLMVYHCIRPSKSVQAAVARLVTGTKEPAAEEVYVPNELREVEYKYRAWGDRGASDAGGDPFGVELWDDQLRDFQESAAAQAKALGAAVEANALRLQSIEQRVEASAAAVAQAAARAPQAAGSILDEFRRSVSQFTSRVMPPAAADYGGYAPHAAQEAAEAMRRRLQEVEAALAQRMERLEQKLDAALQRAPAAGPPARSSFAAGPSAEELAAEMRALQATLRESAQVSARSRGGW